MHQSLVAVVQSARRTDRNRLKTCKRETDRRNNRAQVILEVCLRSQKNFHDWQKYFLKRNQLLIWRQYCFELFSLGYYCGPLQSTSDLGCYCSSTSLLRYQAEALLTSDRSCFADLFAFFFVRIFYGLRANLTVIMVMLCSFTRVYFILPYHKDWVCVFFVCHVSSDSEWRGARLGVTMINVCGVQWVPCHTGQF